MNKNTPVKFTNAKRNDHMKIKFILETTLNGKEVKPGDVADVDLVTYQTLRGQKQAVLVVDETPETEKQPDKKKK